MSGNALMDASRSRWLGRKAGKREGNDGGAVRHGDYVGRRAFHISW